MFIQRWGASSLKVLIRSVSGTAIQHDGPIVALDLDTKCDAARLTLKKIGINFKFSMRFVKERNNKIKNVVNVQQGKKISRLP